MAMSSVIKALLFLQLLFTTQRECNANSSDSYLETYPEEEQVNGTPLHFALIMGFPGGQFVSSGAVAGVRVALDRINSDPYLLQNYTLRYTLTNSSCNRTVALDAFFNQIIPGPTKIGVIGSGCSVATEPTAEVSHYYNITQISCVSSSTELRNRIRFPHYFQLLPTEETISLAYFAVVKEYKWRHVALIVQDENLFTVTVELLKMLLDSEDITYSENIFDTEDGIAGLGENPFDIEARIHIIITYAVHARPLLCEAYKRNITYPRHILFTPAWYSPGWWLKDIENQNITCPSDHRESVLPNSLAFLHFEFLEDLNLTTTTGITGAEYFDEEKTHLNNEPFNLTQLEYAQYCYDATWALAYALNKTINEIDPTEDLELNRQLAEAYFGTSDTPFYLENFTYTSDKLLDIIYRHLDETNFDGVTGPVLFEDQGIRAPNRLTVSQFRPRPVRNESGNTGKLQLDWFEIGHVLPMSNNSSEFVFNYVTNESIHTVWPGDLVPYDGVPVEDNSMISFAVTGVFAVLATAGIILAAVCIVFNIAFRNQTLVRLTSPNLNLLIGFGAMILYVDIYFRVIPSTNPNVVTFFCNLSPWFTAIGYSLCYGTIVVKMCRVYYIFNNPTTQKKAIIKDWMLALGVLVLVVIDLIILITYTVVEGARGNLSAQRVPNRENPEDVTGTLGVITRYYTFICDSRAQDIATGILYGYKALIQIVAIIFAFSIRKVKVKGLDDSKYIAAAVYVTSVVTAVIIVAYYSLKDFVNGFASLNSACLFIGTTFILVLVFVPVMVGVYKDPEGDTVFEKSCKSAHQASSTSNHPTQTIDSLREKIQELENTVAKLKGRKESKVAFEDNQDTSVSPRHTMVEQMMNDGSETEQDGGGANATSICNGSNSVNQ